VSHWAVQKHSLLFAYPWPWTRCARWRSTRENQRISD